MESSAPEALVGRRAEGTRLQKWKSLVAFQPPLLSKVEGEPSVAGWVSAPRGWHLQSCVYTASLTEGQGRVLG